MRWVVTCMLAVILFGVGCTDRYAIPHNIMSQEKMEKVLWDMILADRFSANYLAKDSARLNVKTETLKLYEQVFQINKITKEEFTKSFNFYLSRPDISKVMFDSLSARASRKRPEVYTPLKPK